MTTPRIDKYGNKRWFDSDGEFHRDNGPAVIYTNGYQSWWQHGSIHRDDGPAIEWGNGTSSWWVNDRRLSFDEWLDKVDMSDENKVMMKLKYG
jgi:hypothetical protein